MSAPAAVPQLFEALEAPLATLDRLPRALWLGGMTHAQGELVGRLEALEAWRQALLAGDVPADAGAAGGWPASGMRAALLACVDGLGLAAYCRAREDVTDTVLQSLLFHLDLVVDYRDRGASAADAQAMALAAFSADWTERCGDMEELIAAFGDLGDLLKNTRWDALRGLLRSSEWREVVRIRRLIERLPALARIIRSLGRARQVDDASASSRALQEVVEPASVLCTSARRLRVPELPGETRGVHRAGRIARMLPSEAMLLGHPQLRLIWHARHAERSLLCYEDDDHLQEECQRPAPVLRPSLQPATARRLEMGPMLICVDTSGSMQGGAEAVAKAVVLEAVRCAHAQHRACHVFAFGGPDEVVEMVLGVDAAGVAKLARFLGQSFGGGTDICAPLERAIARLEEAEWQLADLLIASDGEFGATPALADRLHAVRRDQGLRVQGILIGDRETIGLLELADDIHWVRDWRRYGQAGEGQPTRGEGAEAGGSPVHSKSLTASYFPGALRNPENRSRTVSPEAAAAAVRAGRSSAAGAAETNSAHPMPPTRTDP
ncbi:von Willebrand factor type A (vWA) domain-containing protein [Thauera sp. 27]|uniref:VWA domain-containing protein n=1 Tax=Thauera sp. 27 TaxID=305700 RepID=UPI0002CEA764|nr:VWA domain-containing protein [Thauera sp. 27]ENO83141.1 von Willebrand factor type A (vWA) domain-containing protein [Thauera sp. 27]